MNSRSTLAWGGRFSACVVLLVGSSLLVGSGKKPAFTTQDKAYYADANLVAFVRPGLEVQIVSASIAADGTIKTRFKMTDPKGLPLDLDGIYTPGEVSIRFIAAYIPNGKTQYVAYTTRTRTGEVTGAPIAQATRDSNGVFAKVAEGEYTYTFGTKAPAGFDKTATHTIGAYARRNLTEFDLGIYSDDATFNFVPDGSPVTVTRDVIKTVNCNKCHQKLTAHGTGGRQSVEVCVLCHTPQTTDDVTEQTVDMPVMVHKIHMGADLPSVQAGTPYVVEETDFSTVEFPADVRRCTVCHEQDKGAAQATAYLKPNRLACGACHDDVDFATGKNHVGGPQISDNLCAGCHIPEGELEFDASIKGAHTIDRFSRDLPGVVVDLLKVDDGAAGKKPILTFSLKDKSGKPLLPSKLNRLRFRLTGPASDYSFNSLVTEDARTATGTADGIYFWTFESPIPADAKGTYAIGVEARQLVTLLPGTEKEIKDVRDLAFNDVIYFSVDGNPVEPRRTTVALSVKTPGAPDRGCNACHASLGLHGGNRNNPEYCVFCHTPTTVAPEDEGGESVNFALMVHKIHTGEELARDYTVGSHEFKHVRFPGDRRRCDWCHVGGSQQLPLSTKLLPVQDPKGLLNPVGATTSACTACHGEVYAASHALANTTQLGESCAACHKPGADFSVDRVHAQ